MSNTDIRRRARKINLLLLDVDGVLTDGRIIYTNKGNEIKMFDVQDGFGLVLFERAGKKTGLITARGGKLIEKRAKDMRIHALYQHALDKRLAYEKAKKEFGVKDHQTCFVGDELIDLSVMKRVGLSIAVKNARPEVLKRAHMVTRSEGGKGAVREVVEFILKAQGKWSKLIAPMLL